MLDTKMPDLFREEADPLVPSLPLLSVRTGSGSIPPTRLALMDRLSSMMDRKVRGERFDTRGALCMGLVVVQHFKERGFPLDPESLLAPSDGQVIGLGLSGVQSILGRHGITRVLSREGGRTNRGNIALMKALVASLNAAHDDGILPGEELEAVEDFLVERVRRRMAARPLAFPIGSERSIGGLLMRFLASVEKLQGEGRGNTAVGTVMRHLVGAHLDLSLGHEEGRHHASSEDGEPGGTFAVGDAVIHVTAFPGEVLMARCEEDLQRGQRPVVLTLPDKTWLASHNAAALGISESIEIMDVTAFLGGRLLEVLAFDTQARRDALRELLLRYNAIVTGYEQDAGLLVDLPGR